MEHTFTEHWLLQEEPGEPQLMVYQLVERDKQWSAHPKGNWANFLGTHEALQSLAQPETEVILNLDSPSRGHALSNVVWCCIEDSPLRCSTLPVTAQHTALNEELQRQGKVLQVIQCDRLNHWQHAARFVQTDAHEAKTIQAWANGIHTPSASATDYMALGIRLYANTTRAVAQKRVSMTLLALVMLLAFHMHQSGLILDAPSPPKAVVQQKTTVDRNTPPAWSEWQLKQRRFGENRQANITHLQFAWRSDGTVYSQASLQKARKRMPKGCRTFDHAPVVECIQTPQTEPTSKREQP